MSITDLKRIKNVIITSFGAIIVALMILIAVSVYSFPNHQHIVIKLVLYTLLGIIVCFGCLAFFLDWYDSRLKKEKQKLAAIAASAAIDTTLLYPQRIGPIKPSNSNSLLEEISKLSGVSEFELVKSVEEYNKHEKQSSGTS